MSPRGRPKGVKDRVPRKPRKSNLVLGAKQEQAAMLLAAGELSAKDVAKRVGMEYSVLVSWIKRMDFQAKVERYREKYLEGAAEKLKERITGDGPKNLRFLVETRDGRFDDDEKRMGVRLKASQMLFDRQAPKREESEAGGVTIVLNADVMERVQQAQVEEGEWDDTQ